MLKLVLLLTVGLFLLLSSAQEQKSGPKKPTVKATAQAVAVVTVVPKVNTNIYEPSTDREEAALCSKNLEKIKTAVELYQAENKDVPIWLSDLVPKFLSDTNALICPVTARTGRESPFGQLDPRVRSSYLFEFTPTEIPEAVKGAWPGPNLTMRQWKRQQMKLAGSDVPLVRCLLHDPSVNLSVGGKIYESPLIWEFNFTNATTRLEDFSPR